VAQRVQRHRLLDPGRVGRLVKQAAQLALHELDDEAEIADEAQVTTIEEVARLGPPPD
jgi:hypothetical protein